MSSKIPRGAKNAIIVSLKYLKGTFFSYVVTRGEGKGGEGGWLKFSRIVLQFYTKEFQGNLNVVEGVNK